MFNERDTTVPIPAKTTKTTIGYRGEVDHSVTFANVPGIAGHGPTLALAKADAARQLLDTAAHQREIMRVVRDDDGGIWVIAPEGMTGSRAVRIRFNQEGEPVKTGSSASRNPPRDEVASLIKNHPGAREL